MRIIYHERDDSFMSSVIDPWLPGGRYHRQHFITIIGTACQLKGGMIKMLPLPNKCCFCFGLQQELPSCCWVVVISASLKANNKKLFERET